MVVARREGVGPALLPDLLAMRPSSRRNCPPIRRLAASVCRGLSVGFSSQPRSRSPPCRPRESTFPMSSSTISRSVVTESGFPRGRTTEMTLFRDCVEFDTPTASGCNTPGTCKAMAAFWPPSRRDCVNVTRQSTPRRSLTIRVSVSIASPFAISVPPQRFVSKPAHIRRRIGHAVTVIVIERIARPSTDARVLRVGKQAAGMAVKGRQVVVHDEHLVEIIDVRRIRDDRRGVQSPAISSSVGTAAARPSTATEPRGEKGKRSCAINKTRGKSCSCGH